MYMCIIAITAGTFPLSCSFCMLLVLDTCVDVLTTVTGALLDMQIPVKQPDAIATLANCKEMQTSYDHRVLAADLRASLVRLVRGSQSPTTCGICLEELHLQQPSNANNLKIILPTCLHTFHLKCLAKWRCKNTVCPECRSDIPIPDTPQQMLLAGCYIHGKQSLTGKMCSSLWKKMHAAHSQRRTNDRQSAASSFEDEAAGADQLLRMSGLSLGEEGRRIGPRAPDA